MAAWKGNTYSGVVNIQISCNIWKWGDITLKLKAFWKFSWSANNQAWIPIGSCCSSRWQMISIHRLCHFCYLFPPFLPPSLSFFLPSSFPLLSSRDIIHIPWNSLFKVCNLVVFSIFKELCSHYHYLIPKHFITFCTCLQSFLISHTLALGNYSSTLCIYRFAYLDISYKCSQKYVVFVLALFHLAWCFQGSSMLEQVSGFHSF